MPRKWGFAGIVAPGELLPADVAAVLADLHEHGRLRRSLKPGPLAAPSWAAAVPPGSVHVSHTVHTLDLSGGFDEVWKRFGTKTRTKVRKAERAGLVVDCDTTGRQVPIFYDLYRRALGRWAERDRETSPIARWHWNHHYREPFGKFRLVADRLGEACKIWVASLGGRPVAAIIVLIYGANAVYWRAAMDRDLAGPSRANYLLQRLAIEDACAAGCSRYHMGESSPSIAEFKRAFGALPEDYIEYRFERIPLTSSLRRLHRLPSRIADRARVWAPRDGTPEPPSLSG